MNLQGNETYRTNGPIAPHYTCNNKTTLKLGKIGGAMSQHEYPVLMPQSLMADIIRFPGHKYNIIFKEHMDNVILELSRCTIDTQIYTGLSLAACDKLRCESHNDKCCSYTFADSLYAAHRQIDETRKLLNRAKFKARHHSLQTGRFYDFAGGYNPWDIYDSAVSDMLNIPRAITKGNRIFGVPEISKQANTYIGGPLSREQIELTLVMARLIERLNTTMRPLFLHCDTSWARVCQALENWSLDAALYLNKRHALYEQHMAISLVITDILWSLNILEERILLETNENDILIKSLIMARRERLIHYQHIYENGQLADHMKEHPVCFRKQLLSSVDGVCATYGPSANGDKNEHVEYMRKHQNRTTAMDLIQEDIVRKKAWAIKMGLAKASNWMEPGRYIACMETKLVSLKEVPHIVVHTMYQHKGFALSPKAMNRYKDNMVSGKRAWFDYLLKGKSLIMYVLRDDNQKLEVLPRHSSSSAECDMEIEGYPLSEQDPTNSAVIEIASTTSIALPQNTQEREDAASFAISAYVVDSFNNSKFLTAMVLPKISDGKVEAVIYNFDQQQDHTYRIGKALNEDEICSYSLLEGAVTFADL